MNWLKKKHGATLIVWLVLTIIAVICLPNTSHLVRQKGQVSMPASSESARADQLAQKIGNQKGTDSVAIVYHKSSKITKDEQKQINKQVSQLEAQRKHYHVTDITSAKDGSAVAKQVISKNGHTELVNVAIKKGDNFDHRAQQVKKLLAIKGVKTYVTSDQLLDDEFSNVAEEGLKKTEVVAVIFILIVLVLVFRSVIVPLVSLLSVGIAMFISLSLVMNMAKYFNFPISDFTQVFLVIILFGVGTDYNILLYDKLKEALSEHNRYQAIDIVKKTAAHTVLYSGLSVFIGFAALALAKFSFYQSAVSCSVGILVLLLVLLTLNYFFMATLGRKLFWPSKRFAGEQESKVWRALSRQGVRHPLIYLTVFVAIAGIAVAYSPKMLNYDSADEIPDTNPVKQGYLTAQRSFSKGKISPVTINIESKHSLDNQTDLAAIDDLTNALKKEAGVKQVRSVTQPTGHPISQLYVGNQLATLTGGLQQAQTGQAGQLLAGLSQTSGGETQVQSGILAASSYLTDLQKSPVGKQFNIPQKQLQAGALASSYQAYLSNNRKTTQISVILKDDPSGHTAAKNVARITHNIKAQTRATALSKATVAVGGQSSQIVDLAKLSQNDFSRTALIMIAGIAIALLFVTRSVMETGVIVGTLVGTYYTAIDLTALITRHFFNDHLLTWNAPFFAFIMLFALGVDYSIFLMMRYRNKELAAPQKQVEHILSSTTTIGAVVISAIIILGGTFAALLPSGVITLIQVAIIVIIGLLILMVALPVIIPAYIKLAYGNGNNQAA